MSSFFSNVKTVNSALRTIVAVVVLGGVGYGGWFSYSNYLKPGLDAKHAKADLDQLRVEYEEQRTAYTRLQGDFEQQTEALRETERRAQRLATSLKLLKVDKRMANIHVLEKSTNEKGQPSLRVRFTEMDPSGNPIGNSREFTINGEKIFVDSWIVTFEDKYVEAGDALRSCSLCVFKSIWGEFDGPIGGQSLDQNTNTGPGIYQLAGQNEFEQQIWSDFWAVCNNRDKQKGLGIRAMYGQANYVIAEVGRTYEVNLRASGSTSLKIVE